MNKEILIKKCVAFQTVQIAKKFTTLHFQYSDKIIKLAKMKVADGTPINLPLWWLDPSDEEALRIDSGKSMDRAFPYHITLTCL